MSIKKSYVAYFDVLGFSSVVNSHTTNDLERMVKNLFDGFNDAIDQSRMVEGGRIDISNIKFHLFSDSFIIWTEDVKHSDGITTSGDSYVVFRNLLYAIMEILKYGLLNGFPLRGALSYGDIVLHERIEPSEHKIFLLDDSIYGRAYMDAYHLEAVQEWSGCIVTQSAWNQIYHTWSKVNTPGDDPHCLFNKYPFLTWYPVPTKNGIYETIAINWNSSYAWKKEKLINPELIKLSFYAFNKTLPKDSRKLIETLKFWEYTNKLADNVFRNNLSEDNKKAFIHHPPTNNMVDTNNILWAHYSPENNEDKN